MECPDAFSVQIWKFYVISKLTTHPKGDGMCKNEFAVHIWTFYAISDKKI